MHSSPCHADLPSVAALRPTGVPWPFLADTSKRCYCLGPAERSIVPVDELDLLDEGMARLADGDRSAIEVVFRTLLPHIVRCCEKMLGPGQDADDAAQQAMEKVFAEAHRYDRTRRALPWAVAIAVWECRTVRRRRQRSRTVPFDPSADPRSDDASPEDAVIGQDLLSAARVVFDELPPADRETLLAAFAEPTEGPTEVAGATIRKRRERATRRLRDAWRKIHGR
jgi:RNA polymerase sigma factor (sigma-70 family)